MAQKIRIDQLLFDKGYFDSREKARRSVMAGLVFVDQQKVDKPGTKVSEEANLLVKENAIPYVSRGGLKLEKAIKEFNVELSERVCLDIGASTGGFTDCMLKNGAKKVFSIDVGYGQLDWKLRQDPRVVCMERTNVRYVKNEDIGELADFASIDVSFISLKLVLPVAKELIRQGGEIIALVKPQFEAGRENVGKKGVVKDIKIHQQVVHDIVNYCQSINMEIKDFSYSPIKGPEGNIEYLLHIHKGDSANLLISLDYINKKIMESHELL